MNAEVLSEEIPSKKTLPKGFVTGVIVAVLLLAVVGVSMAYNRVYRKHVVKPDAVAITVSDSGGTIIDEISNRQICFYYWGEYYYYINYYGFSFDAAKPLEEQIYSENADGDYTWDDYFMDSARDSFKQVAVLKATAQQEGFSMPEEYQTEYDSVVADMGNNAADSGFANEDGTGDILAYIQDSYGTQATIEDFQAYLYDSYYVSAYMDSVYNGFTYTDADLEQYYDSNEDYYLSYGIEKSDLPNVNVRHILIEAEENEDGTVSEEAEAAAKEKAQQILEEWESGEATEESFAALAEENSADSGSNSNGGLYENVYPGQMVSNFNDWCFDSSRQTGDTGIVASDYGYHVLYFVSHTEDYYWKTAVESEKRYADYQTWLEKLMEQYQADTLKDAGVSIPDAVEEIQAEAAAEAATGSTAADSVAG